MSAAYDEVPDRPTAPAGAGPTPVAILDIDGVLADVRHRLHHIGPGGKDWEAFFRAAGADPLLKQGGELAAELAGTYEIVYLTGRPERTRELTDTWLRTHGLPSGELIMRPDRDHRPAREFKRESVEAIGAARPIVLVVDDDPEVISVLAAAGATTRLADWLPYADPMRTGQEQDGRT